MKRFDLDNDPKIDSGFKIPEDYFEQFEMIVKLDFGQRFPAAENFL